MSAFFASITTRMRLNLFSANHTPGAPKPAAPPSVQASRPQTGRTFPADEVVWGIAIRSGYDELDDPLYHRGTTQHAYLEGKDNVAICGFRPPQSGPRTGRRSRLGLPTAGEHPMCGMCARMVVGPRPRVPIPVQPGKHPVAIPVARGPQPAPTPPLLVPQAASAVAVVAVPGCPAPQVAAPTPSQATAPRMAATTSPWVKHRSDIEKLENATIGLTSSHDSGLLQRGVHTKLEAD